MAGSKDGVRQRLDDLAGMAGGAFSVLAGLKNEAGNQHVPLITVM